MCRVQIWKIQQFLPRIHLTTSATARAMRPLTSTLPNFRKTTFPVPNAPLLHQLSTSGPNAQAPKALPTLTSGSNSEITSISTTYKKETDLNSTNNIAKTTTDPSRTSTLRPTTLPGNRYFWNQCSPWSKSGSPMPILTSTNKYAWA